MQRERLQLYVERKREREGNVPDLYALEREIDLAGDGVRAKVYP